jgi:hypothetical protein
MESQTLRESHPAPPSLP